MLVKVTYLDKGGPILHTVEGDIIFEDDKNVCIRTDDKNGILLSRSAIISMDPVVKINQVSNVSKEKLVDMLYKFFGFDGLQGTYWYYLTRVKEAFAVGTVSLDDFEEMTEETIEELAEEIMNFVSEETKVKPLENKG